MIKTLAIIGILAFSVPLLLGYGWTFSLALMLTTIATIALLIGVVLFVIIK